jgi:phage baseplate assembly protein W
MNGLSVKLPFSISDTDGHWELIKEYKDLVKQNLKMLILTDKGERIMLPNFGVGLRTFLFEPNIQTDYSVIASEIRSQVSRYMPFLDITDIIFDEAENNINGNVLNMVVSYEIMPLDEGDELIMLEEIN